MIADGQKSLQEEVKETAFLVSLVAMFKQRDLYFDVLESEFITESEKFYME